LANTKTNTVKNDLKTVLKTKSGLKDYITGRDCATGLVAQSRLS